jgi:hypothetical protein
MCRRLVFAAKTKKITKEENPLEQKLRGSVCTYTAALDLCSGSILISHPWRPYFSVIFGSPDQQTTLMFLQN